MRTGRARSITCGAALWASGACAAPPGTLPPASPSPVAAGPVTFAPGAAQYRRASHLHVEQQVGGQPQRIDEVMVYFVSVTLARKGDRLSASFTVDSVPRYESGGPAAAGLAERARGATFTGDLSGNGETTALNGGDSTNRLLLQLADEFTHFYPRIPAAGVAPQAQWTDTTQTASKTGGLPLTIVAVSRHQAEPADSAARPALLIWTLTRYSFSGSGTQGGQEYSVSGEGRRHAVERLSADGRFLAMVAADTSNYTISLRGLDVSIPGVQTRADTLSILP